MQPFLTHCFCQVVAIYAGTRGFLDKLAVNEILPFQDELVAHIKTTHPDIMQSIVQKGAIDEATDKKVCRKTRVPLALVTLQQTI